MIFIDEHYNLSESADYEISKLERLLTDLKRIRRGEAPTREELAAAPLIDQFWLAPRQVPSLTGYVTGHPRLGDTKVLTTEVWAASPALGWARTYSRFYTLGLPLEEEVSVQ